MSAQIRHQIQELSEDIRDHQFKYYVLEYAENNILLKRYQSKVEEKLETAKETMTPKITTTNENCTKEGQSNSRAC